MPTFLVDARFRIEADDEDRAHQAVARYFERQTRHRDGRIPTGGRDKLAAGDARYEGLSVKEVATCAACGREIEEHDARVVALTSGTRWVCADPARCNPLARTALKHRMLLSPRGGTALGEHDDDSATAPDPQEELLKAILASAVTKGVACSTETARMAAEVAIGGLGAKIVAVIAGARAVVDRLGALGASIDPKTGALIQQLGCCLEWGPTPALLAVQSLAQKARDTAGLLESIADWADDPYGGEFQRTICTADSAREISEGLGAAAQRFLPPVETSGA